MYLTSGNVDTLLTASILTAVAALLTVVGSVLSGTTIAYSARPTVRYGIALALLFVPFAVGGSVWAYSITRLAIWSGLQADLVSSGTFNRAAALLLLCVAKTVPLGTFFCATTLQRYTSDLRPYFQTHQLRLSFFLLCGLNRIPKSLLMLLGLFGGAVMASEAALPTFLYRANPGTAPETANLMLARFFREIYASAGPDSLSTVAALGALVSLLLLTAALVGTLIGKGAVSLVGSFLRHSALLVRSRLATVIAGSAAACTLVPGLVVLVGLLVPAGVDPNPTSGALLRVGDYRSIIALGTVVGTLVASAGIAVAIRLRYSKQDFLAALERRTAAACLLLLPAFVPVLTIVAVLGEVSNGQMSGWAGYASMFISHVCLHYPVFQFICITLIAAIPEPHVAWQRAMKMGYMFSLVNDGFKRHSAVVVSLVGLGTVQVMTDGSVARWFSHLVKAPEEALYAAVFGRLSSRAEATLITWSVGAVAVVVCGVLAAAYVRDLRNRPRYV